VTVLQKDQPEIGLHTYRFSQGDSQKTIHLRIDDTGSGVLFIDVTDVVHLNATAAAMAKCALDKIPQREAILKFKGRIARKDRQQMIGEMRHIYEVIDGFVYPTVSCPTCSIQGLERSPLFSIRATAPYKADLALTYGCNNQCAHCYNEPERFDMASLPTEGWITVLNKLHSVGVPHVIFTGGEATLYPDLPLLLEHANQLGMICGLNSNGRRLSHIPYLYELEKAGLNHVQITLGSSQPNLHNQIMGASSFDQTVKGLKNAVRTRIHVITNTTLMRCNMGHVDEILDFLFEHGIKTFAMNGMIYSGGGFNDPNAIPEEQLPSLLIRVRDRAAELGMRFLWYTPTEYCRMSPVELELGAKRCNAGEYSICVEPNGDVLPCQSFYVSAGNMLTDEWQDIWTGDLFRSFRDRENDPRWAGLPSKCWECPDLSLCGGGCRIEREARNGSRLNDVFSSSGCGNGCGIVGINPTPVDSPGFVPPPSLVRTIQRSGGLNGRKISGDSIVVNRFESRE
jgi:radical SAM protein with 4Fe4S-binding SPASM domain